MRNSRTNLKILCVLCAFWPGVFLYANPGVESVNELSQPDQAGSSKGESESAVEKSGSMSEELEFIPQKYEPTDEEKAVYETFDNFLSFVCLESVIKKRMELKDKMRAVQSKITVDEIRTGQDRSVIFETYKDEITAIMMSAFFLESVEDMKVNKVGDVLLDSSVQEGPLVMMYRLSFVNADDEDLIGEAQSCNLFFEEALVDPTIQEIAVNNMFENFVSIIDVLEVLKSLRVLEGFFSEMGE